VTCWTRPPSTPVTGTPNLRQPVRFESAVRALRDRGHRLYIEASPHPVLTIGTQETLDDAATGTAGEATAIGSLRRDDGGWTRFLASAAQAHTAGAPVDWPGFVARLTGRPKEQADPARRVDLPTYAFQHQRYWLDAHPAAVT